MTAGEFLGFLFFFTGAIVVSCLILQYILGLFPAYDD